MTAAIDTQAPVELPVNRPPPAPIDTFYTPEQVAEQLQCSVRHVYVLIRRKKIRKLKIGSERGLRITATALRDFVEKQSSGSAPLQVNRLPEVFDYVANGMPPKKPRRNVTA